MLETSLDISLIESPDDCTNAGPCCFSCPHFDQCDHHFDPEADHG